jgi:hypothetical protein
VLRSLPVGSSQTSNAYAYNMSYRQTARFAGLRPVPFRPFPVLTGQWRHARRDPPQVSAPTLSLPHSTRFSVLTAVARAPNRLWLRRLRDIQVRHNIAQHKLLQDVPTRWNSQLTMLYRSSHRAANGSHAGAVGMSWQCPQEPERSRMEHSERHCNSA